MAGHRADGTPAGCILREGIVIGTSVCCKELLMNRTKRQVKLIVLTNLLAASCWGWSCGADLRDAVWTGALDYVTGTTTAALNCIFTAEDCIALED